MFPCIINYFPVESLIFLLSYRPDDFIEAEIVSQADGDPKKNRNSNSNQKIEILGLKNDKKEKEAESGGMFNRLATFFGQVCVVRSSIPYRQ